MYTWLLSLHGLFNLNCTDHDSVLAHRLRVYSLESWKALVFALTQRLESAASKESLKTCLWDDTDAFTDKHRGDGNHDAVHKLTAIVSFQGMKKAGKNARTAFDHDGSETERGQDGRKGRWRDATCSKRSIMVSRKERSVLVKPLFAFDAPLESSGTGTTLAPACWTSLILSLETFEPQRIHGCFSVRPRKAGFVFHSFRIREVSGKRREGSRMSGWGGGEAWEGGRRLANEASMLDAGVREGVYFVGGGRRGGGGVRRRGWRRGWL